MNTTINPFGLMNTINPFGYNPINPFGFNTFPGVPFAGAEAFNGYAPMFGWNQGNPVHGWNNPINGFTPGFHPGFTPGFTPGINTFGSPIGNFGWNTPGFNGGGVPFGFWNNAINGWNGVKNTIPFNGQFSTPFNTPFNTFGGSAFGWNTPTIGNGTIPFGFFGGWNNVAPTFGGPMMNPGYVPFAGYPGTPVNPGYFAGQPGSTPFNGVGPNGMNSNLCREAA